MIAITGANGQLGKATIDYLLQKLVPSQIIAIVRNPASPESAWKHQVQLRVADYTDPALLEQAFAGVSVLLQISSPVTSSEGARQERNVVEAARKAGVQHIIYTSSLLAEAGAEFTGSRQAAGTERAIIESGMAYTFFRNSLYMEAILQLAGEVFEGGDICYPAKYARISFVARPDIAEALSNVLLNAEQHLNKTYEITGGSAWSMYDVSEMLRQEKKLCCRYISIPEEEYRDVLRSFGMPADVEELLCSMARGISMGEFAWVDDSLANLLGREPVHLREYIKGLHQVFQPAG